MKLNANFLSKENYRVKIDTLFDVMEIFAARMKYGPLESSKFAFGPTQSLAIEITCKSRYRA